MKKKVLLGVLTILLMVALVSCDDAGFEKLGQFMGGMGNNVYGIKPNMEEVAEVSNTIDNSVSTETSETGETTIKIDLDAASDIITKLGEIGTSTQKLNQAKEDLKAKVEVKIDGKTEEEASKAVQEALQTKIGDVATDLAKVTIPDTTDAATKEKLQSALDEVKDALTTIKDSIPEEPTQADLATVVIINSLATEVKNLSGSDVDTSDMDVMIPIVDKALAALDALKVTTEAADIDVLGEFNLTSLIPTGSSSSEETGKDLTKEEYMVYVNQLQQSMIKFISLFSEMDNGVYKFNDVKYQRLLLQMKALRSAYELASLGTMPSFTRLNANITEDTYNKLRNADEENKVNAFQGMDDFFTDLFKINYEDSLNLNDLTLYLLSVIVTEMDELYTQLFDVTNRADVQALLKQFLIDNEDNLKNYPIEELDFSAFNIKIKDELEFSTDKIISLCKESLIVFRTIFVITFESGFNEDWLFKLAFNGQKVEPGQALSDTLQSFIKMIDPPDAEPAE